MNERKGEVFSIAAENAPVDGCTVSKAVAEVGGRRISHFALAAGTDISPETYDYHKLWIVMDGEGEVLGERNAKVAKGGAFVTPVGQPVGVKTEAGIVYTEIETGKEHKMKLNPGEAFALKDVLPYAEGRGVIGYEGKEHTIKAGENFAFAKNGAHWVRAEKPFKMALLLTLD